MNTQEPEAAKLKALQEAACMGWAVIPAGRHADVADGQAERFIAQVEQLAAVDVVTRPAAIARALRGQPAVPHPHHRAHPDAGELPDRRADGSEGKQAGMYGKH